MISKQGFDYLRTKFGPFTQQQVTGITAICKAASDAGLNIQHTAYMLATAWHETAKTMQPIAEYGKGKGLTYGTWYRNTKNEAFCYKNGRRTGTYLQSQCPNLFYGRGYVQLTWYDNYEKLGKLLGIDLVKNPDLAMQPDVASKIMVLGMTRGLFTGKKLDDFGSAQCDFVGARRIINGTDCAGTIAEYARVFAKGLSICVPDN